MTNQINPRARVRASDGTIGTLVVVMGNKGTVIPVVAKGMDANRQFDMAELVELTNEEFRAEQKKLFAA